jgi:hypothetical protein
VKNFVIAVSLIIFFVLALCGVERYFDQPLSSGQVVYAETTHTIDFTQSLIGFDGKPLLQSADKPWTLSDVAVGALTSTFKDEDTLPGSKKFVFYELARKVYNNKSAALTSEEITTIKDRIEKAWPTAIMGPAVTILDPNALNVPDKK